MFADDGLVECPVCSRRVTALSRNGICHNCPRMKELYSQVGRSKESVAGEISQFNSPAGRGAIIQRASGRSGKITRRVDKEYVDKQFYKKSGLSRAKKSNSSL